MPKKYTNPDSESNIRRIDSKNTHGFQVHFDRQGCIYTKFFSDSASADKEAARANAREHREEMKKILPDTISGIPAWKGKARSNTGIIGLSSSKEFREGSECEIIQATVRMEKGFSVNRKFRVYGRDKEKAIQKALEWRDSVIAERIERERDLEMA